MTTISAKTILRSRSAADPSKVLSTLLLKYPRCIHAEFMTHRVFSKNSASSRAIPVAKQIAAIREDPFVPLHWGKNQKGMQAEEENEELVLWWDEEGDETEMWREDAWRSGMEAALRLAEAFDKAGYHKQIVNRLIEPFSHIMVLCSGTEWENFLELRDHPDAEPHIQLLARAIRQELDDESTIQTLAIGDWHMPFLTEDDWAEAEAFGRHCAYVYPNKDEPRTADDIAMEGLRKISVARCASTSYKTVDGFDMDAERAQALYDKLVTSKPLHASPLEHVAQVDEIRLGPSFQGARDLKPVGFKHEAEHGNFVGFRQLRHQIAA